MSGKLKRYQQPEVVDHLAANYVLGTLSAKVRRRVERLRGSADNPALQSRILFWERRMAPLNEHTPEIAPKAQTWTKIQAQVAPAAKPQARAPWLKLFGLRFYQWATACSLLAAVLIWGVSMQQPATSGNLSYVAVLSDEQQTPHVVAATYGEKQLLMLDILVQTKLDQQQSLELWVVSKTDAQVRSLGEIPANASQFSRALTQAEWRLIKDSDALLISIEEAGGSPIGEPMGEILFKGPCIRLSDWQEQA